MRCGAVPAASLRHDSRFVVGAISPCVLSSKTPASILVMQFVALHRSRTWVRFRNFRACCVRCRCWALCIVVVAPASESVVDCTLPLCKTYAISSFRSTIVHIVTREAGVSRAGFYVPFRSTSSEASSGLHSQEQRLPSQNKPVPKVEKSPSHKLNSKKEA